MIHNGVLGHPARFGLCLGLCAILYCAAVAAAKEAPADAPPPADAAANPTPELPPMAFSFVLRDQHNTQRGVSFPADRPHILFVGDRHCGNDVVDWYNPIAAHFQGKEAVEMLEGADVIDDTQRKKFLEDGERAEQSSKIPKDAVVIDGVAALKDIHLLLKPFVKWFFRRYVKKSVLMDWGDQVAGRYGFVHRVVNVYVIAPDGRIVQRLTGKATDAKLNTVYKTVEDLLTENS